ncbi:type II 3-dehydroquinate dehydratase [Enterococcus sp. 669A]|uniref:3-dehydroquinate dehydratase n=1 Tax=Candidatus Enterococcus moelleringii TaxID=2815325 RepID=A0ABS3L7J7_9ENTE|nr:type II 3-dehydroquinate dehydratase [Enterococcus sp. 669A]MBO1305588.1 type II 3-dehydroquinate dehydratase [Enterococcus sp. 669A]
MTTILMLHGVNHNMFGHRNPKHYGTVTLDEINANMAKLADELGVEVTHFQTNDEGKMVERIHQGYKDKVGAVIINAGAWTHYSYAIRDALEILEVPFIEMHMSNVHAREEFRHHSVLAEKAAGIMCGFGFETYQLALRAAVSMVGN